MVVDSITGLTRQVKKTCGLSGVNSTPGLLAKLFRDDFLQVATSLLVILSLLLLLLRETLGKDVEVILFRSSLLLGCSVVGRHVDVESRGSTTHCTRQFVGPYDKAMFALSLLIGSLRQQVVKCALCRASID
jgi:hypothetical protein